MTAADKGSIESVFTDLMNMKFVQKDLKQLPELRDHSLSDYFTLYTTKDRKSAIKVYCELWTNIILMKESPKKPAIGFMEVSYSRLKLSISKDEKKLRLIKNRKYEELWNDDEEILFNWYNALSASCIYSNFRSDYEIHKVLGKGNFAKVYLVEEKETKKFFAAKIFDKHLIKNDEFEKKCFLYEIDMLRTVNSSNLLQTFKIYEGENNIYCVGQYCSGGTLYEYIKTHGKPTVSHALLITKQILNALAYLESKSLIHRDLKPENIMFDDKNLNSVTLVDFGFMTKANEFNSLFTRCGTPGYVAPEVLADKYYDIKVDVYSLGILFYILLTKVNPFNHKSYSKLIQKNKSGSIDFQLLESIDSELKPLIIDAVTSMLEKDVTKRPKASELLNHKLFGQVLEDNNLDQITSASPLNRPVQPKGIRNIN